MQADYTIDQLRARVLLAGSFTRSSSEIYPAGLVIIWGETINMTLEVKSPRPENRALGYLKSSSFLDEGVSWKDGVH